MDLQEGRMQLDSGVMSLGEQQQQRRTPRYPFAAPAAILPETGTPIGGNVKELSLYGCYLDAASTLTARSRVLVKIFMPGEYFEANATVAYANPALGLGLVFRDVKPHFLTVLRKWLIIAMQSQPGSGAAANSGANENPGSQDETGAE
jgi:hypothetical protein